MKGCATLLVWLLLGVIVSAPAQEMVTISKRRLEELERKEAELEKLKAELNVSKSENAQLKEQHQQDTAKIAAQPAPAVAVTHVSPPLASLPAFSEGQTVDAMDLANYYRADAAAADQRFRKRKFNVQGEITAFEKPPFVRDYRIILKSPDRDLRVVCTVYPPDKYSAVFTIKNGSELVGQLPGGSRESLAKVGDQVTIEGQCRGVSDSAVRMGGCQLK